MKYAGTMHRAPFAVGLRTALVLSLLLTAPGPSRSRLLQADPEYGVALFEQNRLEEARAYFETLADKDPSNSEAAYFLGRIYFRQRDFDKAERWLKKAVQLAGDNPDYRYWLASVYSRKMQEANWFSALSLARKARKGMEAVVELNPDDLRAREDLMGLYYTLPGLAGGNKDKARRQVEEVRQRDPVLGHILQGLLHATEKEYPRAEQEYLAAAEIEPGDARVWYQLGLHYQNRDNVEESFNHFDRATKIGPREWALNACYQYGRLATLEGTNLDTGVAHLQRYVAEGPTDDGASLATAHWRLGLLYAKLGRQEDARGEFQTALKINPDHKEAKESLKELRP